MTVSKTRMGQTRYTKFMTLPCVLKPLEWSGLLSVHETTEKGRPSHVCFKTPLWRTALSLETDGMLDPALLH